MADTPLPIGAPTHTNGPAFSSSRIIRLSECADDEKDAFIRFFADQRVQFFRDVDGSFVANVRLYDPNVIDMAATKPAKKAESKAAKRTGVSTPASEELSRSVTDLGSSAAALDFSVYQRFTSSLSARDSAKPKARPLSWLMRQVEEMYDNRYAKDTADLRGENGEADEAAGSTPFPTFVVEFFSKRYGLRSLIDQTCWDLLYNVHALRREHLEVEIFARFLEEYYDPDDLLFFLYVRSVVQKELNVSFRSRWTELGRSSGGAAAAMAGTLTPSNVSSMPSMGAPAPLYLSFRDCQHISRVVFGSEADPLYRTFIAMIERHMSTAPRESTRASASADARRIEVTQFLNLALVEYHETRPADEQELAGITAAATASVTEGASGSVAQSEAQRLFEEAVAAYEDRQRGGDDASASDSATGSVAGNGITALLRRNPKLVDDLGQAMHDANVAYVDQLLTAAAGLPAEVQAQIREEVQKQLEDKVDVIFASTIKAAETGAVTGNASRDALVSQFTDVLAAATGDTRAAAKAGSSIPEFCASVLRQPEVANSVEPLVTLLTQYAAGRLSSSASAPAGAASIAAM